MLQNYIKIALRSLLKSKIYSLINILGLTVGIASCLLILLHVEDDLSYDSFHEDADQIYKLVLERSYPDHVTNYAITPHTFTDVMVTDFPEVAFTTRIFGGGNNPVMVRYVNDQNEEKAFEESRVLLADSTFFDMFSYKLLQGDANTVLTGNQSMVITEEMALKYFGDEDPLNKTLKTDFGDFIVMGVCENIPANSHIEFDFLATLRSLPFIANNENFVSFSTHTYVKLNQGVGQETLEAKFPKMVDTYAAPQIERNLSTTYQEYIKAGNGYNYSLIPLADIHLFPIEYQGEFKAGGDINDVYIFISIAVLILIIACINFMNLATARSTERAKEVGIRKTLGSPKKLLISQFLTESVILSLFSTLLALGVVYITLPSFNVIADKQLVLSLFDSMIIPMMVIFAIFVGLLAGSYPAFFLSSFNPAVVLKGKMQTSKNSSWLRNSLVVFQFAISIVLIAGTLTVNDQMNYIKNKDLGFNKDRVLVVERAGILATQQEAFMNKMRDLPNISAVGGSSTLPVNRYFGIQFRSPGASEIITVNATQVDDYYANVMEFELVSGRSFSTLFNDSLSIVINEQTAALLGVKDPIGMKLSNSQQTRDSLMVREFEIIGVVKNFHYMSLKDLISPFVLMSTENAVPNIPFISARVNNNMQATIGEVEAMWKEFVPQEPFKYSFLDQELQDQYQTESNTGKVFGLFATLAIIIACVGLFGLAAYMAGLRTKEVGVRKVMGASVFNVALLLSKDFTKLVLASLVIALPSAWFAMDAWLSGFAYRVELSLFTLVLSGMIALLISWVTVSYQSIKAAVANPVKSLASE
jgi:putative ABC transport system permease protein